MQAIWDLVHGPRSRRERTENHHRQHHAPSSHDSFKGSGQIAAKGVLGWGLSETGRVDSCHKPYKAGHLICTWAILISDKDASSPTMTDPVPTRPDDEPDYSKYEYWRQTVANPELHRLFMALCDYALSLGDDVMVNPTAKYISIRRKRTVAYIKSQTGKIRIIVYVYADLKSTSLLEGFTRKLPESFRNPPCNLEITIRNHDDLKRAKPLLKRSYDESGLGGERADEQDSVVSRDPGWRTRA